MKISGNRIDITDSETLANKTKTTTLVMALMRQVENDTALVFRLKAVFPDVWNLLSYDGAFMCRGIGTIVDSTTHQFDYGGITDQAYVVKDPKHPINFPINMGSHVAEVEIALLHDRLDEGLSHLSGIQQQGLQGTSVDHEEVKQAQAEIQAVLWDIAQAMGASSILR